MSRPPLFRALAATAGLTGALLAGLAAPALAATGCTTLSAVSLATNSTTGTLSLTGTVTNCTDSPDVVALAVQLDRVPVVGETLDPACVTTQSGGGSVGLRRGASRTATVTGPAPTCAGDYDLQVTATTSAGVVTAAAPIRFTI